MFDMHVQPGQLIFLIALSPIFRIKRKNACEILCY